MEIKTTLKPFDKETKSLLLQVLKKGFFEKSDISTLSENGCIEIIYHFAPMAEKKVNVFDFMIPKLKPFDKRVKILLLKVIQKRHFKQSDIDELEKSNFLSIELENPMGFIRAMYGLDD